MDAADNTSPVGTEPVVIMGIDAGRHRLFLSTNVGGRPTLRPLSDTHDGLLTRWVSDQGPRRFSERIREFAGIDDRAEATAADVGQTIALNLLDFAPHGTLQAKIAISPSFGPRCRQAVLDGLARGGITASYHDLVERPIAAAAGWLTHRLAVNGAIPDSPVILIDNDAGELSAVALDPQEKRLLAVAPLNVTSDEPMEVIAARLADFVAQTARLTHPSSEILRETDRAASASRIAEVAVTGSGALAPELALLISSVLPASALGPDPVAPVESCVAIGLGHLDIFNDWTACWPTVSLRADDDRMLVPGGSHLSGAPGVEISLTPAARHLGLSSSYTADEVLPVVAGSCVATGIAIPRELGTEQRLKILDDGRLLVLGPHGATPLAVRINWPCPGSTPDHVAVRAIGRRAITMSDQLAITQPPD